MEKLKEAFASNPQYGYLLAAGGMLIFLTGLIVDADWAVEPGGGYFNVAYWIKVFGRKTVRIFLGIVTSLGILACLFMFINSGKTS